jgi:AcrR family transcriptional regulator
LISVLTPIHPTKQALIKTLIDLLETKTAEEISVDEVLQASGISKGSLYHHFADYSDLVEDAMVIRYGKFVDLSMELMHPLLDTAKTKEEFIENLKIITRKTQSDKNSKNRMERARLIGQAGSNERLRHKIGKEQKRLNDDLNQIIQEAINKEFFSKDLDAQATALFIQTYSLGLVLNDIAENPLDKDRWTNHIDRMIELAFISK